MVTSAKIKLRCRTGDLRNWYYDLGDLLQSRVRQLLAANSTGRRRFGREESTDAPTTLERL